MITKFSVRNFKSIESASLAFKPVSFLVGRNGTGKTNLVDALSFISEAASSPLQMLFNSRGGTESVFRKVNPNADNRGITRSVLDRPRIQMAISLDFSKRFRSIGGEHSVSASYSLELESGFINRPSFERAVKVSREQIIINDESGSRVWLDRKGQKIRSNEEFFSRMPEGFIGPDALALPLVAGFPQFARLAYSLRSIQSYSIDPGTLRDFQEPDAGERLFPNGSNAVAILEQLRRANRSALERLLELLSSVTPGTVNVTTMSAGRKRFLRFSQAWGNDKRFRFEAYNMSEGTLRAFGLLLAIFQPNAPNYMIVEQPEDSLHPGATSVIIEALRSLPRSQQVVITTHSPEVLDLFVPDSDAVYVAEIFNGTTRVNEVAPHLVKGVAEHLCSGGDLLRLRLVDHNLSTDQSYQPSLFEELA